MRLDALQSRKCWMLKAWRAVRNGDERMLGRAIGASNNVSEVFGSVSLMVVHRQIFMKRPRFVDEDVQQQLEEIDMPCNTTTGKERSKDTLLHWSRHRSFKRGRVGRFQILNAEGDHIGNDVQAAAALRDHWASMFAPVQGCDEACGLLCWEAHARNSVDTGQGGI